jgi:hypothetical protein
VTGEAIEDPHGRERRTTILDGWGIYPGRLRDAGQSVITVTSGSSTSSDTGLIDEP